MLPIGIEHLLIALALALLFFGGRKLPELGKRLGEGLRPRRFAEHPYQLSPWKEKLEQLGDGRDDAHFIQCVGDLCHPDAAHRDLASFQLMNQRVQDSLPTGTLLREVRDAHTLRTILATRNIGLERAAWRWAIQLKSGSPSCRTAAAFALAAAEFEPAIPALLEALADAPPDAYLAAIHSLARLKVPAAAPALAAFAVEPPPGAFGLDPDAPGGPLYSKFPLRPLLRAYWLHYQRCNASDPAALPRFFARDAMWELGEADLLQAARDLSQGNGDRAVALKDPRLFEALAVALARCPRSVEARPVGLAAIRGLVALGDARSMGLLDWFGRPWRRFRVDPVIWEQAHNAERYARSLRGSHVVPSAAPGGSGSELAGSADPPERRAP